MLVFENGKSMFDQYFAKKIQLPYETRIRAIEDVRYRLAIAKPWKAIVFGSMAEKTATTDSDLDVLVVCRHPEDIKRVRDKIYSNLKGPLTVVPVDFIFVTRDRFERQKSLGGVCMAAFESGELIYGTVHD
jgi:predicted nucleotidyltransferase